MYKARSCNQNERLENFCQIEIGVKKKKKEEFKFDGLPELDREVIQNIQYSENDKVVMFEMVTKV
ncbi:17570_t:CDS:2 [Gigaspora margarita]|uniref:17570_t:CDS:1 n=1 Tax=Gigaspora margarita TaxID=4874 RepID=A0ABN7VA89_GIGMA|nr:17570_t:CDS:2 [Gigaspora margarita]